MLAIPIHAKVDDSQVEEPLRSFLKSHLGDQLDLDQENDIRTYSTMRSRVACIIEPSEFNFNELLRFHHLMKNLAPRLEGYTNDSKYIFMMKFGWCDAFKPTIKATWKSLYFDWANILWNYGALASKFAAMQVRSTEEGLREANKHFQLAAGVFEYIQSFLLPKISACMNSPGNSGVCPSFSNDSLTFAKTLNLAQAQLCFYEKAVNDKKNGSMKSSIIAKLAAQTSILYTAAGTASKVVVMGTTLDSSWSNYMDFQAKVCLAASEYWQSQASKDVALQQGRGFGEEITRLAQAELLLQQALTMASKFKLAPSFVDVANGLLSAIVSNKSQAENDNRVIYLESPPNYGTLAAITGVLMVKPLPIPEVADAAMLGAMFKYMVPRNVKDLSERITDRIKSISSMASTEALNATNEGRVILSSVGLPGSLESFKAGGSIPESLWEKTLKVQSLGGVNQIRAKLEELFISSQEAKTTLASIENSLSKEEAQDRSFRMKYGDYQGLLSTVAQREIRENLARLRDVHLQAQVSDEAIVKDLLGKADPGLPSDSLLGLLVSSAIPAKKLDDYGKVFSAKSKDELMILVGEPAGSDASTTASSSSSHPVGDLLDFSDYNPPVVGPCNASGQYQSPELLGIIQKLEIRLVRMAELIDTRENLGKELQTMNAKAMAGDYSTLLIDASRTSVNDGPLQSIVDDIVSKAEAINTKLKETITDQEKLLDAEILPLNDQFIKAIESDPATVKRNKTIAKVESVLTTFYNWHSQLSAGVTFYSDLQSRLSTVRQSSDDLSCSQQFQRQDFEMNMMHSFQRIDQEKRDHELALRIASELNVSPVGAAQPSMPPTKPPKLYESGHYPSDGSANPYNSYPPAYPHQPQQQQQQQQQAVGGYAPSNAQPIHVSHQQQGPYPDQRPSYGGQHPGYPGSVSNAYSGTAAPLAVAATPALPAPLVHAHSWAAQPPPPPTSFAVSDYHHQQHQQHQQQRAEPPPYSSQLQPTAAPAGQGFNAPVIYGTYQSAPPLPYGQSSQPVQPLNAPPPPYNSLQQPAYAQYSPSGHPPHQPQQQPQQSQGYQYYSEPQLAPPGGAPQQSHSQMYPSSQPAGNNSGASNEAKIYRLMEMGFPRPLVEHHLTAHGFNEESALNAILSSPPDSGAGSAAPPAAAERPKSGGSGGLFGNVWGRR